MKKNKCRFQTAKDGKREMVVPLSRDFMRTADKMAALLGQDRDQMILDWFDWGVPCLADNLEDNVITHAEFKSEADCLAYIGRMGWSGHAPLRTGKTCWIAEHPFDRERRLADEAREAA